MTGRTLILYTTHERNDNTDFFSTHGVNGSSEFDFLFCLNNSSLSAESLKIPKFSNTRVITTSNIGWDFGGWSTGLFASPTTFRPLHPELVTTPSFLFQNYSNYIFLNSSCRGPFLPSWFRDKKNWAKLFTQLLTAEYPIVGCTIGFVGGDHDQGRPHIQSYAFALNRLGLNIALRHQIFAVPVLHINKVEAIIEKEEKLSRVILEDGYNLRCLLLRYRNTDFRRYRQTSPPYNLYKLYQYEGQNIHPYEVIFLKTSSWAEGSARLLERYTPWHVGGPAEKEKIIVRELFSSSPLGTSSLLPADFDWREYLCLNPDVARNSTDKESAILHWTKCGHRENRRYRLPTTFENIFNWENYLHLNPELSAQGIETEEAAIRHFVSYGYRQNRRAILK